MHFPVTRASTGLNPAHVSLPFYADVDVQEEDARIRDITDRFKAAGMSFFSSALSMDALCEHVAGGGMAIVLVDSRFLPHAALFLSMQPSYVGHFVLVVCRSMMCEPLQARVHSRSLTIPSPTMSCT